MLRTQLLQLNDAGLEFLAKAKACTSPKDVQFFADLGLRCLAEAREIFELTRRNSVILFAELSLSGGFQPRYAIYLEFAARNGLDIVSEEDFDAVIRTVFDSDPKLIP